MTVGVESLAVLGVVILCGGRTVDQDTRKKIARGEQSHVKNLEKDNSTIQDSRLIWKYRLSTKCFT